MLSLYAPLNEVEIVDVQVLRPGTVFLLVGQQDEKLVIKVESGNMGAATLKHAKVAIKAVDASGGGKVKALTTAEIQALDDWCEFIKKVTNDFNENKLNAFGMHPGAANLMDTLKSYKRSLWYKMPMADLTDAEKMIAQRLGTGTGTPDKTVMTLFAEGLNAVGGIEQIGRIIAADMYNSNQDRFNPIAGSKKIFGNKTLHFKAITNPGNVFVIGKDTQQRISFSGHDFIDPNSGYKDYSNSLGDIKEAYNQQWLGEHLCSKSLRKKFVKNVVGDLETIITPNKNFFSPFSKLSSKAGKRLETGMLDGMRLIVTAVSAKYNKGGQWPPGVKNRFDKFSAALK